MNTAQGARVETCTALRPSARALLQPAKHIYASMEVYVQGRLTLPSPISRNSIPFQRPDHRILCQDNFYPLKKRQGMKMER